MNMKRDDNDSISKARSLCHQLFCISCVEEKSRGLHEQLLRLRPHWSISKKDEQFHQIDLGESVPFDIALPLPARDKRTDSDQGIRLFWERFSCQRCGRCCYTPGAGLYLEKEDFERIGNSIGKNKLRIMCNYKKNLGIWILKQPCPFYNRNTNQCEIYSIRPLTCTKYPLHPPLKDMPYNLAVDAFCPAARKFAKETLGWWIICENHWANLLGKMRKI
jgi:uncharacterized protein